MTPKKTIPEVLSPSDILGNFKAALTAADHVTTVDSATVALGYRLASSVNVAFDEGDLDTVALLAPKLLGVLQELRLTVKTRGENNGEQTQRRDPDFTGDYLRLIAPKN